MIEKLGSISRTKSLHPRISAIRATHFSLLDSPRQMKPSTLFKPLSHNPTTAPFLAFRPRLSFKFGEFREIPSTCLRPCSFIFPPPLSAHTCIKGFLAILFPCEDSRHPLLFYLPLISSEIKSRSANCFVKKRFGEIIEELMSFGMEYMRL